MVLTTLFYYTLFEKFGAVGHGAHAIGRCRRSRVRVTAYVLLNIFCRLLITLFIRFRHTLFEKFGAEGHCAHALRRRGRSRVRQLKKEMAALLRMAVVTTHHIRLSLNAPRICFMVLQPSPGVYVWKVTAHMRSGDAGDPGYATPGRRYCICPNKYFGLYIYIYVCVCVCVCIYIYIYDVPPSGIWVVNLGRSDHQSRLYTNTGKSAFLYTYTLTHIQSIRCMHIRLHVYVYIYIYIYTYIYICIRRCPLRTLGRELGTK